MELKNWHMLAASAVVTALGVIAITLLIHNLQAWYNYNHTTIDPRGQAVTINLTQDELTEPSDLQNAAGNRIYQAPVRGQQLQGDVRVRLGEL